MTDFRALPDLAVRNLGGSVVSANDEAFAARENLITPGPAVFDPSSFGHRGKVYDGWETRRRRGPGPDALDSDPFDSDPFDSDPFDTDPFDTVIVRLGAPGIVRGIVVDTSWFTGNYPPEASVEGCADLGGATPVWETLVPRSAIEGDTENVFAVATPRRVTHVRLRIFPDGGVARLRVHGEAVPDPGMLDALGTVDLAAIENGGLVAGCSNLFYSSPHHLLLPGPARSMGEGWETARRRDDGHDWVEVTLAAQAVIAVAELDTSWFLHNAPGSATLRGRDGDGDWSDLLPRTALAPDTRHRFVLSDPPPVTAVRLDIHPDGGLARLRMWGTPTSTGRATLTHRWHTS